MKIVPCLAEPATIDFQKTPSADSIKSAYAYLNSYIAKLREDKLTEEQKNHLNKIRKQVKASLNPQAEEKIVDTHQLWLQLGELEKELSVMASALDLPPPQSTCAAPMTRTQLSVRPPKRTPNMHHEEPMEKQTEPVTLLITQEKEEFNPEKD